MAKLRKSHHPDLGEYWLFKCPGCHCCHWARFVGDKEPVWTWNENPESPTIEPSLLVMSNITCHSFIRDGNIQFLDDCTHELRGQTVEIPDWDNAE